MQMKPSNVEKIKKIPNVEEIEENPPNIDCAIYIATLLHTHKQ